MNNINKPISFNRMADGTIQVTVGGNTTDWYNVQNVKAKVYTKQQPDYSGPLTYIIIKDVTRQYYVKFFASDLTTINGNTFGGTNANDAKDFIMETVFNTGAIVKKSQTITFAALPNKVHTDPAFTLSASSSSGLAVAFTSADATKFTCSGTNGKTCTPVAAGTANVQANQAGNTYYNAAPQVTQPLTIT